jgi:hypothetical protein
MHRLSLITLLLFPVSSHGQQQLPAQQQTGQPQQSQSQQGQQEQQQPTTPIGDLARANGMAQVLSAAAANQNEQTRQQYIQNQGKAATGYLDIRRYNKAQTEANRSRPLSPEQYVRGAREQAPSRLEGSQLDRATGEINWPAPLRSPRFSARRARIERLLQQQAQGGQMAYGEIHAASNDFLAELQAMLPATSANDYMLAKRFLESLQQAGRVN